MKTFIFFLLLITQYSFANAQEKSHRLPPSGILRSNLVSGGVAFAIGNFSSTHSFGFSVEYSRCWNNYGRSNTKPAILFSYAINAGISHFTGKKETVSSYPYKYPANNWLYATGGIMALPAPSLNISLTAGPALMLYNQSNRFALSSKLEVNYFVKKRIAISPFLQLMKEGGATVFWAAGVKGGFAF